MARLTTIQLKVLIHETLQSQIDLTKFLRAVAQRYGYLLNEEEANEGAVLMHIASETIDRLTDIIDNATITISDDKRPPDKLPVYREGGWWAGECTSITAHPHESENGFSSAAFSITIFNDREMLTVTAK